MRIGVTLENTSGLEGNVCMHFGQCTHFLIIDIEDGKIAGSEVVPNGVQHGGGGCQAVDELLTDVTHTVIFTVIPAKAGIHFLLSA